MLSATIELSELLSKRSSTHFFRMDVRRIQILLRVEPLFFFQDSLALIIFSFDWDRTGANYLDLSSTESSAPLPLNKEQQTDSWRYWFSHLLIFPNCSESSTPILQQVKITDCELYGGSHWHMLSSRLSKREFNTYSSVIMDFVFLKARNVKNRKYELFYY